MKKLTLLAPFIFALTALSCTEEEKSFPPATVEIQNILPQDVSVQFELVHDNAVSVGYRVETTENAGKSEFTVVGTSELKKIVCDGLTQETEYQITAVAYNQDGAASKQAVKKFKTEKTPAAPASVSVVIDDVTYSSVAFKVSLKDAVKYAYGVAPAGSDPDMTEVQPEGQEITHIVRHLTSETDYKLSVIAYNADNVATEAIEKEFKTGKFVPFGDIKAVPTAHGIFIKSTVDAQKYPLYFLQVFDPQQTYSSGDFTEQFKVDSKEQFIHYLQTAILNPDIRQNSFQEWNKTMLSSKSSRLLLYAVPIVRNGADYVCEDYGMIVEQTLDIPENDALGQSDAAIIPGDLNIREDVLTTTLSKQGEPVAFYAGVALKSDVDAEGGIEAYTQKTLDAKKLDYNITSIANFKEEIEIRDLALSSDYIFFTFAYDANGKLGNVQAKTFSTTDKFEYKTDISVEVALKEVAFTSAVFSVKRTNFKNGKYNFVTMKDFTEKYGSNVDKYVMQELIGQQSGYPKSLYSDNDIKESRLQYNTDYIMIVLPESDAKDGYGKPVTVRFHTKVYEQTSNASVSLKINKIESFYGVSFYANVTATPSEDCAGYYTYMMDKAIFEVVENLGETVCKTPNIKFRSATDTQTFNTDYFYSSSYLIVIPVDKNGKFGAPVNSELLETIKPQ